MVLAGRIESEAVADQVLAALDRLLVETADVEVQFIVIEVILCLDRLHFFCLGGPPRRRNFRDELIDESAKSAVASLSRTAIPADGDEGFAVEELPKSFELFGFLETSRQPILHFVSHSLDRHPRAAHGEWYQEKDDHQDQQAVSLKKWAFHAVCKSR